jgi:hypothetical protein
MENSDIRIYRLKDGKTEIFVQLDNETVWLNLHQMVDSKQQLKELQVSVKILGNVLNYKALTNDESIGLLKIISDYANALDILDQYDYQRLETKDTTENETFQLTYEEAMKQILTAKKAPRNSVLFGHEKDDSFKSSNIDNLSNSASVTRFSLSAR